MEEFTPYQMRKDFTFDDLVILVHIKYNNKSQQQFYMVKVKVGVFPKQGLTIHTLHIKQHN